MNTKLIAFDLDGTLTQHKSPLSNEHRDLLNQLAEKYRLLMLGAGNCDRIYRQMQEYPIEIIGNYGMQHSIIENGSFKLIKDHKSPVDREFFTSTIEALRRKFGFTDYFGESVEFHASGAVTFPILGTAAPLDKKLAYDPDRLKRRAIYREVCRAFDRYNVFIGGSSSFDITAGEFNKFHALKNFCLDNDIPLESAVYVGDDFGEGGNDSPVMLGGVRCISIDDYRNLKKALAHLL